MIALNTINYTKFTADKWNVVFQHTTLPKHFTVHHLISLALVFHKEHVLSYSTSSVFTVLFYPQGWKKKNNAFLLQSLVSLFLHHFLITTCSIHCSSQCGSHTIPKAVPSLALGERSKSTTMQLVFQSVLGLRASQHVLSRFVIAHQSPLLRFRSPCNQSSLVLSWMPSSSVFTAMVDVPGTIKSNVLRGLCLFRSLPSQPTLQRGRCWSCTKWGQAHLSHYAQFSLGNFHTKMRHNWKHTVTRLVPVHQTTHTDHS